MKERVRLTEKAYQLIDKVREGLGTSKEEYFADYFHKLDRRLSIPSRPTELDPPTSMGYFRTLERDGYLEVYQDEVLDYLDSIFPVKRDPELFSELDEFEILEKGESLLEKRSYWKGVTPEEEVIIDCLDSLKREERLPLWAIKGLVRDKYIQKVEEY